MSNRRGGYFVLAAALTALSLMIAACSSSDDGGVASLDTGDEQASSDSDSSSQEQSQEEAILEMAACLRDKGQEVPDPQFDENGNPQFGNIEEGLELFNDPAFVDDLQACQNEVGFQFGPGQSADPREQAELRDQQEAMANCLREKDFDIPDVTGDQPDPSQIAELFGQPGFQEAATDCAQEVGFDFLPGGQN